MSLLRRGLAPFIGVLEDAAVFRRTSGGGGGGGGIMPYLIISSPPENGKEKRQRFMRPFEELERPWPTLPWGENTPGLPGNKKECLMHK